MNRRSFIQTLSSYAATVALGVGIRLRDESFDEWVIRDLDPEFVTVTTYYTQDEVVMYAGGVEVARYPTPYGGYPFARIESEGVEP